MEGKNNLEQDIYVTLERHDFSSKSSNYLNIILTWSILIAIGSILLVLFMIFKAVFFTKPVPRSVAERTYYYYLNQAKKQPEKAISWLELGRAELSMGRHEEAIKHFKKALKIKPKVRWAHFYLALCYQAQGDIASYIEELQAEIKNVPNNHYAYYLLGEEYYRQGRYKEAIQSFQKTIEYSPTSSDAHFFLAQAYEQNKQIQLAIAEYNEVLRYVPDHPEALEALKRLTGQ